MSARLGAVLCVGLTACAQTYPGGAVQSSERAIEVAVQTCALPNYPAYSWHVLLKGDEWIVTHSGSIWIPVDARSGKIWSCHAEG
jgi:hypothetical protein